MRPRRTLGLALGASLLLTVAACGSSPPSSTYGAKQGPKGFGDTAGDTGGENGLGDTADVPDDLQACATSSATAEAKHVYLVFVFDKSGSMIMDSSPKWSSSKAATKAFFSSPESKGLSASLTFFPSDPDFFCSVSDYAKPQVGMTALPNNVFGQVLDAQFPEGGTPTLPALQGAISYAQNLSQTTAKDGKVAIVLVTDGLPDGCAGNTISGVRTLAASVATTMPTYVIGVGNLLSNLDQIAEGGGTQKALIVADQNPTQIQADFQKAIQSIKQSALSCDYSIPTPPNGEQLETGKVNVVYKNGTTNETLQYNQSCAGGTGWRYDDPNNPTRILMCDGSCGTVKTSGGAVDVLFGCKTQTGPVK
jgi:hypothetical protein